MRRTMIMVIMCAALVMAVVASADDQTIPPEAHWTPTPPGRSTADGNQLVSVLVDTGMITPHEYTQLTHPEVYSPSQQRRGRGWTWDEIDHHPVRSTGGE